MNPNLKLVHQSKMHQHTCGRKPLPDRASSRRDTAPRFFEEPWHLESATLPALNARIDAIARAYAI